MVWVKEASRYDIVDPFGTRGNIAHRHAGVPCFIKAGQYRAKG